LQGLLLGEGDPRGHQRGHQNRQNGHAGDANPDPHALVSSP